MALRLQPAFDAMTKESTCCAPARPAEKRPGPRPTKDADKRLQKRSGPQPSTEMVSIPGGSFIMGTDSDEGFADDGEGPAHKVRIAPFQMDVHAVSNRHFSAFVENTGYRTDAESYGWSFVFHLLLPKDFPPTKAIACAPWWRQVEGAFWRRPEGPHSSIEERLDHPVVHVSWNDAMAFARWAKKRLPTEAEWECAARGGLRQARYSWGDELTPGGEHRCNIWQGEFPADNTCEDGFLGTAPVDSFAPNGYGLYNAAGNVWEWCADWFSPTAYQERRRVNPKGPRNGSHRVIRGGSYLCHDSYCNRYRVAARSHNEPDSSTGHMGFRCARDL